jgi:hypothetical protein
VIAMIARGAYDLVRTTVGKNPLYVALRGQRGRDRGVEPAPKSPEP